MDPVLPEAAVADALARCLALTGAARDAAAHQDWEAVGRLQQERETILVRVPFERLSPDAAARTAPRLRELLASDRDLVRCAAAARSAVLDELRQVRRRRDGSARYQTQHQPNGVAGGRTIRFS